MTRLERLARQEARAQAKVDATKTALSTVQAAKREETQKARNHRRYEVGTLADQAGLCGLDDGTLAGLFALVSRVKDAPDPLARLEELLCVAGGSPGTSVDGMAELRSCQPVPC